MNPMERTEFQSVVRQLVQEIESVADGAGKHQKAIGEEGIYPGIGRIHGQVEKAGKGKGIERKGKPLGVVFVGEDG